MFSHEGRSTGSSGEWLSVLHDRTRVKQEEIIERGFIDSPISNEEAEHSVMCNSGGANMTS